MSLVSGIALAAYQGYSTGTFKGASMPLNNPFQLNSTSLYDIYKASFNNSYNAFTPEKVFGKDYAKDFEEKTENTRTTLPAGSLTSLGYNAQKGQKLANIAIKNTIGFTGQCATYAKRDIEQAGLGKYESGHAYQCDDILRKNPNFKEISTAGLDLKKLPAGCVLVYEKGVSGYSNSYGHIEITDGQGGARSDGKTNNIRAGAKVFIPV